MSLTQGWLKLAWQQQIAVQTSSWSRHIVGSLSAAMPGPIESTQTREDCWRRNRNIARPLWPRCQHGRPRACRVAAGPGTADWRRHRDQEGVSRPPLARCAAGGLANYRARDAALATAFSEAVMIFSSMPTPRGWHLDRCGPGHKRWPAHRRQRLSRARDNPRLSARCRIRPAARRRTRRSGRCRRLRSAARRRRSGPRRQSGAGSVAPGSGKNYNRRARSRPAPR